MTPNSQEQRRMRAFENAAMIFFSVIVATAVIGVLVSIFRPGPRPASPTIDLRR